METMLGRLLNTPEEYRLTMITPELGRGEGKRSKRPVKGRLELLRLGGHGHWVSEANHRHVGHYLRAVQSNTLTHNSTLSENVLRMVLQGRHHILVNEGLTVASARSTCSGHVDKTKDETSCEAHESLVATGARIGRSLTEL
jgi:hypothetical protein